MKRIDIIAVVWPGFMLACVLEVATFAFVDPADLSWGSEAPGLSRQGIQTITFFVFWLLGIATGGLALLFASSGPKWESRGSPPLPPRSKEAASEKAGA
ncbi:conserved hypothetical protein [Burkholderiales bacterium 8X]|nr:conserved hypothetical protein [Burkholderiales bacterium 8X]